MVVVSMQRSCSLPSHAALALRMPGPLVQVVILFARYLDSGRNADAPAIDGAPAALGRYRAWLIGGSADVEQKGKWSPQCAAERRGRVHKDNGEELAQQGICGFKRIRHAPPIARRFVPAKSNRRAAAPRGQASRLTIFPIFGRLMVAGRACASIFAGSRRRGKAGPIDRAISALAMLGRDRALRARELGYIGAGVEQESKSTRHQRTARLRKEFHEDLQHEPQQKPQQPRHRLEEFRHAEGEVKQLVMHTPPIAGCLIGTSRNTLIVAPTRDADGSLSDQIERIER